jgi:hypothetical protein
MLKNPPFSSPTFPPLIPKGGRKKKESKKLPKRERDGVMEKEE